MKLKCIGGVHDGEYVYVDSYYHPGETSKSVHRNKYKQLAVDHCHETGKIRGLLCLRCNQGIGLLKHNSEWLMAASLYCEAIK